MSYALPPRSNNISYHRKRTSRRRSQGVARHDSFPCEESVDSDKAGSPIVRRSNDEYSNANPVDDADNDADDADDVNETFSMTNDNRRLAATRDDGNNKCKVLDAQQLDTASGGRSIEQYYGSHNHKKLILSSIVGVAIFGASMTEDTDRQGVFLVVCILAIIFTHTALNKLIQHSDEGSRRLFIASSPSDIRGLQSGWSGLQSRPRITFELGLRNNNAPAASSHKNWRQVKTTTNNIITADSPLVAKEESSSIVRSKELTQLLEERKKSSSILFASDSMTIKPPMQTLTRLEKRNWTMRDNKH